MTQIPRHRLLFVALAIVAVAVAVPLVSAHGSDTADNATTADDASPNGTAADWEAHMKSPMTEHMGPGSVEWMDSHMGSVAEMAHDMTTGGHDTRSTGQDASDTMHGQGHC